VVLGRDGHPRPGALRPSSADSVAALTDPRTDSRYGTELNEVLQIGKQKAEKQPNRTLPEPPMEAGLNGLNSIHQLTGRGELVGSGIVETDRWRPISRRIDPFVWATKAGRQRVERATDSGERVRVGYAWHWYAATPDHVSVLSMTRRIHLSPGKGADDGDLMQVRSAVAWGLEHFVNDRRHRLPALQPDVLQDSQDPELGPLLQVRVEFVDSPERADSAVQVFAGVPNDRLSMTQDVWFSGVHPVAYVHEIMHGIGVTDDHQTSWPATSIMGPLHGTDPSVYMLTREHLQQILDVFAPYSNYNADTSRSTLRRIGENEPSAEPAHDIDRAPKVNYKLVHRSEHRHVVESRPGESLWHFSTQPPEHVFREGFSSRDPDNIIRARDWTTQNTWSQFISTTRDRDLWFMNRRYRYEIEPWRSSDPTGVDILATLGNQGGGVLATESEVAFVGRIDAAAFVRVTDRETGAIGTWDARSQSVIWTKRREIGPVSPPPEITVIEFSEGGSNLTLAGMRQIAALAQNVVAHAVTRRKPQAVNVRVQIAGHGKGRLLTKSDTSARRAGAVQTFFRDRVHAELHSLGRAASGVTSDQFRISAVDHGNAVDPSVPESNRGSESLRIAVIRVDVVQVNSAEEARVPATTTGRPSGENSARAGSRLAPGAEIGAPPPTRIRPSRPSPNETPYIGRAITQDDPDIVRETRTVLVQKLLNSSDPAQFRRIVETLRTHANTPARENNDPDTLPAGRITGTEETLTEYTQSTPANTDLRLHDDMAATLAHAEPTVAQLWLSRLNPEARRPEHSQPEQTVAGMRAAARIGDDAFETTMDRASARPRRAGKKQTAEPAAVPQHRTDTSGDASDSIALARIPRSFADSARASVLPDGTVFISDGELVITTPRITDEPQVIARYLDEPGETQEANLDEAIAQLEHFARRGMEKLSAEKYKKYMIRARAIMDGRHRIPRLGDDVEANREREILEQIRLIVAHQVFLDDHTGGVHEQEKGAVYVSEWLRSVFNTAHTDGFMVPAGAIGVEIEFPGWGLIPGSSQSEAQIPNTLLRTSLYSIDAEFPDAGAPYIELVGPPIAVTDGDTGRLRKREFVRAAEDFWSRLQSSVDLPRPSLKEIFPDAHIRSSAQNLLVRRVPERPDVLGPQFTVGVPVGSLFAPLSLFHQEIPENSYMAKLHSATGQKFGTMVAAQFSSYVHRDRVPVSMLPELMVDLFAEDVDVTAIRGLMYLTYTHVAAQLHWELLAAAQVPGTSLAKNLVAVLSRTSFAGIRSESSRKIRRFLEKNRTSIRNLFTSFFSSSMRGERHREIAHFLSGGNLLDVPITDAHGATVGDYLDNALMDAPRVLLDQEITFGITHFVRPDVNPDASGRRQLTPSALLELRHYVAMHSMQDVWRTLDNLVSVSNYIYQQDERVRSSSSTQEGAASISRRLEEISTMARDATNNPIVAHYFDFLRRVWSLELASLDLSISGPLLSTVSVISITDSMRKLAYGGGGGGNVPNASVEALGRLKKKLTRLEKRSGSAESPLKSEIREANRMASELVKVLGGASS
jgi:hypothetical protein